MPREDTQFKPGEKPAHTWTADAADTRGKPRAMTPKQGAFVEHYLKSNNGRAAALAAGYSAKSADSRAYDFLHNNPATMQAITEARKTVMAKAEYNLEALMTELDTGAAFAVTTKNATALARFVELKAKACGLLIERIDQRQVGSFELNITGIDGPVKISPPQMRTVNNDDGGDIFS